MVRPRSGISFGNGFPLSLAQIGVLPARWAITLDLVNTAFGPLTGPGLFAFLRLHVRAYSA